MSELHQEFSQPLHVAYIDTKAAFDSVDRSALWKTLGSHGAPPFLIQLIEDLHAATTSQIRIGGQLSEPFESTQSGVRQDCEVAPALFCIVIDWILARCTDTMSITVCSSRFTHQDYADDAVLFTDCPSKWPPILSGFDEAAHTVGLSTSWLKTKIQNLGHGAIPAPVQLLGHVVDSADRFTYLGSDMHSSERSTRFRSIGLTSNIFSSLTNSWKQSRLSMHTKMRLYNALVISVQPFHDLSNSEP